MKTFLKPYWVYLTTLVPVAALFALYGSAYQVVHTLLSNQNVIAWASFGGSLATITFAYCAYAFWCQRKGRDLPAQFGFFLVAFHVRIHVQHRASDSFECAPVDAFRR